MALIVLANYLADSSHCDSQRRPSACMCTCAGRNLTEVRHDSFSSPVAICASIHVAAEVGMAGAITC